MLVRYVILENYKSYAQARVEFTKGTNAIIGDNGAGKSTILEAIGFALFNYRPTSLAGCLREGSESGSVTVCMQSSLDERDYEIERRFTSHTTSRYRVLDPELGMAVLAEGNKDVQAWLREHLRVSPTAALDALFENAVGVPQGTYTAPFLQPASVRKAVFNPLLQVEEYGQANSRLLDTQHYLDERRGALAEEIAHAEGQLERTADLKSERDALVTEMATLDQQIGHLAASRDKARSALEQFETLERAARETGSAAERARDKAVAQERLLDASRDALRESESAAHKVQASQAGHEAYVSAEKRLQALEKRRTARDEIAATRQSLERQMVRLSERKQHVHSLLEEIAESARQAQGLQPLVAQQAEAETALNEAGVRLQQHQQAQRDHERAERELTDAQADLSTQSEHRAKATTLQEALQDMRTRLEETNQNGQDLKAEEATAHAEIARLQEQSETLESATAKCPVCEAELTPQHRRDLLTRNREQIKSLETSAKRLRAEVVSLREEYKHLYQEIRKTETALRELPSEADVARARQQVDRRQAEADQAQQNAARLAPAAAQVEDIRARLERLENPRKEYERHQERAARQDDVKSQWDTLNVESEEKAAKAASLDEALQAYATLEADIAAAQRERAAHLDDHTTYLTNRAAAAQLETRATQVADLRQTVDNSRTAMAKAQEEEAEAQAAYDAQQHRETREKLSDVERTLAATRTRREERARRQTAVEDDLAYLKDLAVTLEKRREDHARQSRLLRIVVRMRELLRQAGPYITRQLVRQISQEASHLYGEIMEDHRGHLRWTEDYEIVLQVDGRERQFAQLSGGEQMSAALAVRLAALHETSAIDIALFDEPTAHLDPERRDRLAENIGQIKGFSQMFVISHDDTFERVAQNYVHITKDAEGSHSAGYQEPAC